MACFDSKLEILPFIVLCVCVCVCVCVHVVSEIRGFWLCLDSEWGFIAVYDLSIPVCVCSYNCVQSQRDESNCLDGKWESLKLMCCVRSKRLSVPFVCPFVRVCVFTCDCVQSRGTSRVWKKKRNCCFWQICRDLLKLMVVCARVSTIVHVCVYVLVCEDTALAYNNTFHYRSVSYEEYIILSLHWYFNIKDAHNNIYYVHPCTTPFWTETVSNHPLYWQ